MIKVKLFSHFANTCDLLKLLVRQTPEMVDYRYKDLTFVTNDIFDYGICFNWPDQKIYRNPNKVIGFLMEPPELEHLDLARLSQIGMYFTPVADHQRLLGNRFKHSVMLMLLHTPINIDNMYVPSLKHSKMSMIVSKKDDTPFQKKRLDINKRLMNSKLPIDFYGRDLIQGTGDDRVKGPLPPLDKQRGLFDYSMSLAFENSSTPECISEKLYDCAVNNCIPITNAPGAAKYLPDNSYIYLDFNENVETLVRRIELLCAKSKEELKMYDEPVLKLKKQILSGDLSLAEGIYKAIMGLHLKR